MSLQMRGRHAVLLEGGWALLLSPTCAALPRPQTVQRDDPCACAAGPAGGPALCGAQAAERGRGQDPRPGPAGPAGRRLRPGAQGAGAACPLHVPSLPALCTCSMRLGQCQLTARLPQVLASQEPQQLRLPGPATPLSSPPGALRALTWGGSSSGSPNHAAALVVKQAHGAPAAPDPPHGGVAVPAGQMQRVRGALSRQQELLACARQALAALETAPPRLA